VHEAEECGVGLMRRLRGARQSEARDARHDIEARRGLVTQGNGGVSEARRGDGARHGRRLGEHLAHDPWLGLCPLLGWPS
jgi:hypothetical protein